MPCYHPLAAYRTGSGEIIFAESQKHDIVQKLTLPCGQCIGCRLERSRQWAMRCMHEASLHKQNAFATLTYSDANLPKHGSLNHADIQKFLKRLRKKATPAGETTPNIRYYMCGEYGRTNPITGEIDGGLYRPHYHLCIFNFDFADKSYWTTRGGNKTFRSETLERLWPYGNSELGNVTFESAAYVARYCTQKLTGPLKKLYGERAEEYNRMSLNPAIGKNWLQRYEKDVYPHDYVIVNGKEVKPPKYYDRLFEKNDPEAWRQIAIGRELDAHERASDNTPERLKTKEIVAKARHNLKKRS